jgi:small subunit ribosomal protein S17e
MYAIDGQNGMQMLLKQTLQLSVMSVLHLLFLSKPIFLQVALIPSKPLRNKIAGFITHLMKRLQRSTVRGISIKLQEEERERRDNYVPDVSALEQDIIEVDSETKEMLKMMDFQSIPGLQLTNARPGGGGQHGGQHGGGGFQQNRN